LGLSVFGDSSGDSLRVSVLLQVREPAAPSPYSPFRFYVDPWETSIFGKFSSDRSESQRTQGF